jgi:gluconolactonase
MNDRLSAIFETTAVERLATGFELTEGPLWDPDGGWIYFVDTRHARLYKITTGDEPEVVRDNPTGVNGTTFDLEGRIIICESPSRRVTRLHANGQVDVIAERFEGNRLNRPNDVICASDGSIYFTDPARSDRFTEREIPYSGVYRVAPDGELALVADCEYPNGLAFSPDERVLYVANSRNVQYVQAIELDANGTMVRQRIFADMSAADGPPVPDGIKVDAEGRVFATGPGGVWVLEPDGTLLGIMRLPEPPANLAFGGPDLKTLFFTARTSLYTMRVKTPGLAHPRFRSR